MEKILSKLGKRELLILRRIVIVIGCVAGILYTLYS